MPKPLHQRDGQQAGIHQESDVLAEQQQDQPEVETPRFRLEIEQKQGLIGEPKQAPLGE